MTVIENIDQFLLTVVDGMPREPRQYEFRCHPGVVSAIRDASDPLAIPTGAPGWYGSAAVVVDLELGPGGWELRYRGELMNSGRLPEKPAPSPHARDMNDAGRDGP